MSGPMFRADSGESLFLRRELQAIEARLYETPIAPFDAARMVPFKTGIPAGAQEWGYDRVTMSGMSKWLGANARDIPRANVEKVRVLRAIKSHAVGYGYTREDVLAAQMKGVSLDDYEARGARRAIDQFRNEKLMSGDTEFGFEGFINSANVPQGNATNGGWATATGDDILQDISDGFFSVVALTKKVYWPTAIALPVAQFGRLTTTRLGGSSDVTIEQFVRKNLPQISDIFPLNELAGAGEGATDRMVIYLRDPEVLEGIVPLPFEQLMPQEAGLEVFVPCHARTGGTHWRTPIAAAYVDGI